MKWISARTALASCLFLAGCASSQARLDALQDSASGTMADIKHRINDTVQPAVDAVNQIDKAIKKVQSGAEMIQQGIGTVKEAL